MSGKVLVTGGAGFIGSHVCKRLAAAGVAPIAFDSLEKGHAGMVRWGPLVRGDIGDRSSLIKVITEYNIDAIVHLAGYIEVGRSMREPALFHDNNVARTAVLIETAESLGVENFVFSSTCAVFGTPVTARIGETHPFAPMSVYADTKLAVERLLAAPERRLKSVVLRYFNAAGADPDGEIGEMHDPETHLMPLAIDAALGFAPPLTIFGDDYPTPDGTCVRDYVHVEDLAEAHLRALAWLDGGGANAAFNLGSGTGHSVRELIDATSRVSGLPVPHSMGPRREGDPSSLVADPTLAAKILGWTPKHDLDAQLEHALRWRRSMPR